LYAVGEYKVLSFELITSCWFIPQRSQNAQLFSLLNLLRIVTILLYNDAVFKLYKLDL